PAVSGVSGSGKSTLVHDTLYRAVARVFKTEFAPPGAYDTLTGTEYIKGVRLIDQEPIGRTPRSNPITYVKAFDEIRKLFAALPRAKALGLDSGAFSFNVQGGRCESCQGDGFQKLEMYFFEDVYVACQECEGRRYRPDVLGVKLRNRSISDVLHMTVDEAVDFFAAQNSLARRLQTLQSVGLGYLRLGQAATTLSGGEAQRLKIAAELGARATGEMFYILDEPTTGLHLDDVKKLLGVLNRLVDAGNTVLVVEHHLDVIKSADYVIDLGPDGRAAAERRRADRRSRPEVDERLTSTSLAIVGGSLPPVSEARHWVEAMQRGVQAVRGALDDHDRLEHEALAVRLENDRLRAEIDRSSKELAEIDATITRAIELVTDLRSRLHKEPWREPTG